MSRAYHRGFTTLSIVLFAITLLITTPVMATDFYVAAGGVDYGASGPDSKSLTKSNGCSDSKTPCGSITHATALAKAGDVINLGAGVFSRGEAFPLFIRKGVTLQGSKDGSTIIEGSDTNALVVVEADSPDIDTKTIIRNIKIRGNYEGAGLSVGGGSGSMQSGLIKSGGGGMNAITYGTGTYTGTNAITGITTSSVSVNVFVTGSTNTANVSLISNVLYYNFAAVYVRAASSGVANVNMRYNYIVSNYVGVGPFAVLGGVANVNMTSNAIVYNVLGVRPYAVLGGDATVNMNNNYIVGNYVGASARAVSSGVGHIQAASAPHSLSKTSAGVW